MPVGVRGAVHLCAVLPNVRIMEIDIDDVPWKQTRPDRGRLLKADSGVPNPVARPAPIRARATDGRRCAKRRIPHAPTQYMVSTIQ